MTIRIDGQIARDNNKSFVYQTIKSNIMELILEPGQAINESDVGKELSVSRTPVREAFIRLSEEHLINTYPQRGSYVSKIDMRLVQEGSFMRRCLEKAVYAEMAVDPDEHTIQELRKQLAIQKAVVQTQTDYASEFIRLDDQFHSHIFFCCGKSNIWNSIVSINTHFNRLRYLDLKEQTNIYKVLFQHEMLIEALEGHKFDEVESITESHQLNVIDIIDEIRDKYKGYFL